MNVGINRLPPPPLSLDVFDIFTYILVPLSSILSNYLK